MNTVIIGNIITFIGSLVMTASGFLKEKKAILLSQSLMYVLLGTGMLFLGGITGACVDFVNVGRNLYTLKYELTTKVKLICIALEVLLTICFNRSGLLGCLPVTTSVLITWTLSSKDEVVLKAAFILCQIMWAVYDVSIRNYATFVFDVVSIITTLIGIWRVRMARRH